MKADLNTNIQPNFQARVSPRFVKFMQSYINNGRNRLQNTYKLNSKLEQIDKFGYDNYTIELINRDVKYGGKEFILAAIPDGASFKEAVFIDKKANAWKIINSLLNMGKSSFTKRMRRGEKIKP